MDHTSTEPGDEALTVLDVSGTWPQVLEVGSTDHAPIEPALLRYVARQRWFRSKAREPESVRIVVCAPLAEGHQAPWLLVIEVRLSDAERERYVMFVAPADLREEDALAELRIKGNRGQDSQFLIDVSERPHVAQLLLDQMNREATPCTPGTVVRGRSTLSREELSTHAICPLGREQTNTSFAIGTRAVLKLLRRVEPGQSLELEVLRHLEASPNQVQAPALLGHLELCADSGPYATLATLQGLVPNSGDAWQLALCHLRRFYESVLADRADPPETLRSPVYLIGVTPPVALSREARPWLSRAEHLGRRTGELHCVLASATAGAFLPEDDDRLNQSSLVASIRSLASRTFHLLRTHQFEIQPDLVREVLGLEERLHRQLSVLAGFQTTGKLVRVHGDLHLGQVLCSGDDFVIIDFEGEPARPLDERRRKRSPLVDVAGMLRSFHYAAFGLLTGDALGREHSVPEVEFLTPWAHAWWRWSSACFLRGYLAAVKGAKLLSEDPAQLEARLNLLIIEKALYEICYELNNRPAWATIPLTGLLAVARQPFHDRPSSG